MHDNDGEGMVDAPNHSHANEPAVQQAGAPAGWTFSPEGAAAEAAHSIPATFPTENVSWTASEYIAHHKSLLWFAGLGLIISALSLGAYLLTHELITAIVFVIIGLSFGIFGARQPRVLEYSLDEKGLHIDGKLYSYDRIRSFDIVEEGPIRSILLMPLQRFMPPLSVYYDPSDETSIIDVIGSHIPHEERGHDIVDKLMSKIRF